ncbi:casein kinase 2 regulatory subunit [Tulasnella sp. 403]|nr:casein kinase 2 regulatory subunit [Tulasnella sp. 403]
MSRTTYPRSNRLLTTHHRAVQWISWFLSSKGNEYFCEVEEDYILDRFNLTGLNTEVQNYSQALDLITDSLEEDLEEEIRGTVEISARLLYGLIHQRWIVTSRGLAKMLEKYKKADFGRCPRVLCHSQPLLPCGLTDLPYEKPVKLYCPRCEDLYSPKSSRHGSIDGAYFGSTFPHMFLMVYPHMIPSKVSPETGPSAGSGTLAPAVPSTISPSGPLANATQRRGEDIPKRDSAVGAGNVSTAAAAAKAERYMPKIFGFKIHEIAKWQRWQGAVRDR